MSTIARAARYALARAILWPYSHSNEPDGSPEREGQSWQTRGSTLAFGIVVALGIPLAPLWVPCLALVQARRRQKARAYREVIAIREDAEAWVLLQRDGTELRLRPAAVRSASCQRWSGDVQSSDEALVIDGTALWANTNVVKWKPLVEALAARGVLERKRETGNPADTLDFATLFFALGVVVDLLVVLFFVSRVWFMCTLLGFAWLILSETGLLRPSRWRRRPRH